MRWRRSFIGYRAKRADEYLRALESRMDDDSQGMRQKVIESMALKISKDDRLATLREETEARRARLDAVEAGLVNEYYKIIRVSLNAKRVDEGLSASDITYTPAQGEEEDMSAKIAVSQGLFGISKKDFEAYVDDMERKHEVLVKGLANQLERLEKSIEEQNNEIKALESKLKQPEMQKSFIELAEKFLTGFEDFINEAARDISGANAGAKNIDKTRDASSGFIDRQTEIDLRTRISKCRRRIRALKSDRSTESRESGRAADLPELSDQIQELSAHVPERSAQIPEPSIQIPERSAHKAVADLTKETRYQYLLDKTLKRDLITREGEVILRRGEPVTASAADKAYQAGLMEHLALNIA